MSSSRKKILIITRYFIPYIPSIGGVMRVFTLARFLEDKGYDVYILSRKGHFYGYFGYENTVNKLNVTFIGRDSSAFGKITDFNKSLKQIINRFKWLFNKMCIPDENIFNVRGFTKAAEKIIIEHSIINVLISSPPHGMQIAGLRLKKKFGNEINLIVDYRDSWNTTSIFKHPTMIGYYLSRKIEKKILDHCDYFTYVSFPMLSKIERLHSIKLSHKAHLIMNGYIKDGACVANDNKADTDKISVGYFGSLGSGKRAYRSVDNLIDVLLENSSISEKYDFYFYGPVNLIKSGYKRLRNIHLYPTVTHDIAINKMSEMDFLLMVHTSCEGSDEVITGKFFEYVSVKKPIICLAPADMEGGRLVRENGIGIHLNIHDKDSLKSGLAGLEKPSKGQYYKDLDTTIFSREFQYTRLLDILY